MGKEAVVKVDSELLRKVEEFIKKEENRIRYANRKQFVDIAIVELLEKESKRKKSKINLIRNQKI
ncbi:MAG: hypothetical protein ABH840_01070 [Nanoarchaeota archaeon]